MTISFSTCLNKSLDDYYALPEDTYIYVPNLTFNGGIRLIHEAIQRDDIKVYKSTARRKTEKSKWLQHVTIGAFAPSVFLIKLSNGVKILDYCKFDPNPDVDPEEALELAKILVERYKAPITPSSIIRENVPYLNTVQGKNKFGAVVQECDKVVGAYSHQSLFGGAVYNMRRNGAYRLIDNEVHIDYHQMYAHIMKNYPFPDVGSGYVVTIGYQPHPLAVYHICGGEIRLKKDGFPLLALDENDDDREGYFDDWKPIPWQYLTDPDLKTLLENFEINPEQPLEIDETFNYNRSIDGMLVFGDFIQNVYNERLKSTGAVKRFYKMLNEYLPGSFERKQDDGRFWADLTGPESGHAHQYNSIVGAFITAYGRQLLNGLLHMFPHDKVIGYDTDCVFFHGTTAEVPQKVLNRFGDGVGQLHFDGIYTNVRHLSAKQYYGLEEGKPFGKMSAVPNGDKIAAMLIENGDDLIKTPVTQSLYVWNVDTQDYDLTEIPARISLENYQRDVTPIQQIRGVWIYE